MTEDISKLPKWAQYRIARAENKLADTERLLAREVPTKVRISRMHDDAQIYLPDDRGFVFTLPDGEIEVRIKDGGLEVYARQKGLSILPQVTNVVKIKLEGI